MMRLLDVIRLRLRSLVRRRELDADLDRELREHLDRQVDENLARGMTRDEATRVAASTFGGYERVREEARDARGISLFENLGRDLRYALRGLRREPILLVTATVSIALGAGGNLAVYSLAREFVFAQPDVRQPDEVVQFQVSHGSHASYQRWLDLDASDALAAIAGYSMDREINWRHGDAATSLVPMLVTANFFDVTGIPLVLGRAFSENEARTELQPRLAVLTHAFWRNELSGDSAVLGRPLMLNGEAYTIIGVLAPRLRSVAGFSMTPPVYVPLNPALVPELPTSATVVRLLGRLKPGQTLEQGRLAVDEADRRLGRLTGDTVYAGAQNFAHVGTLGSPKTTRVVGGFFVLLAVVSFMVLLIACANVAGLLIARGTRRRQEIAIRLAIGGTRSRLVQQFLVEGFWLALIGTGAGMALTLAFMRILNGIALPVPLPITLQLAPDPTLFAVAAGLVFVSILLCGILPALGATRLSLVPALKREEPQYATRRLSARGVLLTTQVTVSTVLLVTAFLFVRNLARTQVTDPGFEVEHVAVAQLGLVRGRPVEAQRLLLQRAAERAAAVPGVERVAYASAVPLTMYGGSTSGTSVRMNNGDAQHVEFARSAVGPGYFETLGVRRLAGREFVEADRAGAPPVAIINAEFARRYLGGRSPTGSRIRFERDGASYDIVGMVANGKHVTLGEEQRAAIYVPLLQDPAELAVAFVLARTRTGALAVAAPLQATLTAFDQSLSVDVKPMRSALAFALLPSRIGATVLGVLGSLGVLLAAFGLYALVAYSVSRRVSEIAIRSALGATRGGIIRLVMRDAAVLVGVGVTLGLAIAAFITAPLSTFLVAGLSPTDPLTFAGTGLVFILVSVLASWLPARSAVRVSPVVAMRLD